MLSRTSVATTALVAVAVGAITAAVVVSRQYGMRTPVSWGDTGNCIGSWSQPSNAVAQRRAAGLTDAGGDGLPLVAVSVDGGGCRVAVAASSSPAAPAHVFEARDSGDAYQQVDSPRRPLRVAALPPALRRWVSRVNGDGTLVGHP